MLYSPPYKGRDLTGLLAQAIELSSEKQKITTLWPLV